MNSAFEAGFRRMVSRYSNLFFCAESVLKQTSPIMRTCAWERPAY